MKNNKIFLFLLLILLSFSSLSRAQWVLQHSGLPNSVNPTLVFSAVDSNVCWGVQWLFEDVTNPKYILTTDDGQNWSLSTVQIPSGLGVESIAAINAQTAFIAVDDPNGTNSGIYKTTNGGTGWVKQGSAYTGAGSHPQTIYFFDSNNGLCIGNPKNNDFEIYTTTDAGNNWFQVPGANIPNADIGDQTYSPISFGAGNSFWFGTGSRKLYKTTDKGLTWEKIDFSVFAPNGYGVDIGFKDTLNGLAVTYFGEDINRAFKTTDGGTTWTTLPNPPTQPSFYFLSYVPGTEGMYVATSNNNIGAPEPTTPGSMFTSDGGQTWNLINNLPYGPASFAPDGTGWSGGVNDLVYKWDSDLLVTSVQTISGQLPNEFNLGQNYPNPFNPTTTISFSIPASEFVTLKVYDVLGNEVATLVDEEKPAGSYEVNFNAAGLSSGIYFYTLQAGSYTQTKKLILMK